jgi:hypothetical protein
MGDVNKLGAYLNISIVDPTTGALTPQWQRYFLDFVKGTNELPGTDGILVENNGLILSRSVVPGSSKINVTNGTGVSGNITVDVDQAEVDHDSLSGFVADEHIAHSNVTLTAGSGLSGGGTIAANRTFNVDITSENSVAVAGADEVLIADNDDSNNIKKVTANGIALLKAIDLFRGTTNANLATGTTYYLGADNTPPTSENDSAMLCGITGNINRLYVEVTTAPGAGESYTFTMRKNGSDESMTGSITETATTLDVTTNTFSVVAGDNISIKMVTSAGAATATRVRFFVRLDLT